MLKATARTYRNAYSGLSRSTWLLSFVMLINRSGTMVVPFMTLYLVSIGYTVGEAGIVFGLFGLGAFSGAWLGGKLTDKFGYYPVQIITLTGGGILFMILGQVHTYPLICLFTYLVSFVGEAFRPANSTAIAFYSKEENRTRSYALNRLAINLGWAAGSAVGGFLANINYELLFWVDGVTNILAAVVMWLFLKPVAHHATHQEKKSEKATILAAHKDKVYVQFVLITALFASCFFQMFNNIPVFFNKVLQLSEPTIGLLMALNGIIIALIEMILVYKLESRNRAMTLIIAGVTMVGLSFWILNIPAAGIIVALNMILLVTVGEIFAMPFMNSYWISRTQPSNRGQYAALYTMAWSAAQTLGPMGGAQLAQHFGFTILWWVTGGLALIAAFSFYRLSLKRIPV